MLESVLMPMLGTGVRGRASLGARSLGPVYSPKPNDLRWVGFTMSCAGRMRWFFGFVMLTKARHLACLRIRQTVVEPVAVALRCVALVRGVVRLDVALLFDPVACHLAGQRHSL